MPLPNGGAFALGLYGSAILIDADGTEITSFSLPDGDYDTYPVVGSDGVIYVAGTNTIHAINPDGSSKWNKTSTQEFQAGLGLLREWEFTLCGYGG